MRLLLVAALSAALISVPLSSLTAKTPDTWDGLYLVQDKSHGTVYLLPGVDFRKYSKVMLDPTEVAFRKDWQKGAGFGQRIGSAQMRRILDEAGVKFGKSLTAALQKRGYVVVQQPGDDVLRIWP